MDATYSDFFYKLVNVIVNILPALSKYLSIGDIWLVLMV